METSIATGPKSFLRIGNEGLRIIWNNETTSDFNLKELRFQCPCAKCVDEWSGKRIIKESSIPDDVVPLRLFNVGRYAVGIQWSDGHNSGIYSYDYLLQLAST